MTQFERSDWLRSENFINIMIECAPIDLEAAATQWPVGSNWVFLLRVSPVRQTPGLNQMVKYNTFWNPEMVSNGWFVPRALYCCQMQPFLSGRLGDSGVFLSGRFGVSDIMHIRDTRYSLQCFLCPIVPNSCHSSVASWEQWGCSSTAGWESPMRQILGLNYMVKFYTSRFPWWFPMFDVFHVPHMHVNCSHSTVAIWE